MHWRAYKCSEINEQNKNLDFLTLIVIINYVMLDRHNVDVSNITLSRRSLYFFEKKNEKLSNILYRVNSQLDITYNHKNYDLIFSALVMLILIWFRFKYHLKHHQSNSYS